MKLNYYPIRLLCHSLKIFECILANGIRDFIQITINRTGLVKSPRFGITHGEASLSLQYISESKEAFHRVPHKFIWYALWQHLVDNALYLYRYSSRRCPLLTVCLLMDIVTRHSTNLMIHADIFLASHNKPGPKPLVQIYNRMNESNSLTIDSNETLWRWFTHQLNLDEVTFHNRRSLRSTH